MNKCSLTRGGKKFTHSLAFDLGEDVNALRDMAHRLAQDRVKPVAAEIDRNNAFPPDVRPEMGALG